MKPIDFYKAFFLLLMCVAEIPEAGSVAKGGPHDQEGMIEFPSLAPRLIHMENRSGGRVEFSLRTDKDGEKLYHLEAYSRQTYNFTEGVQWVEVRIRSGDPVYEQRAKLILGKRYHFDWKQGHLKVFGTPPR